MSYITKKPYTHARRKMIVRQQISDLVSYGSICTSFAKAKMTQKTMEKLITSAKSGDLASFRKAHSVFLRTKKYDVSQLVDILINQLAVKYFERHGGCTRVLKLDKGALLQLV